LLIDEIDRADEEFEAFLLELLSAYQISIPEMGTIKAKSKPHVILTSNRTRELSDALKRRCLYNWVPYPSMEKELKIIQKHLPNVVQKLRKMKLDKSPGIAETIDWARGVLALDIEDLNEENIGQTLSCLLKSNNDFVKVENELVSIVN